MNIKIKATGVACLVGDDYDRVYAALLKQFGEGDSQLFSERIPGHEYLQWELPGEGWTPLSEGDPLMVESVRRELLARKQAIIQRFGQNQEMAQKILSVPDDSYVFYKSDTNGNLMIRLTAWGYRYPERVGGGGASGGHRGGDKEHVRIHVVCDDKPVADKQLFLNGFKRTTDSYGIYDIGDLPVGYHFELKVDEQQQMVCVASGQGDIIVDLTIPKPVEEKKPEEEKKPLEEKKPEEEEKKPEEEEKKPEEEEKKPEEEKKKPEEEKKKPEEEEKKPEEEEKEPVTDGQNSIPILMEILAILALLLLIAASYFTGLSILFA